MSETNETKPTKDETTIGDKVTILLKNIEIFSDREKFIEEIDKKSINYLIKDKLQKPYSEWIDVFGKEDDIKQKYIEDNNILNDNGDDLSSVEDFDEQINNAMETAVLSFTGMWGQSFNKVLDSFISEYTYIKTYDKYRTSLFNIFKERNRELDVNNKETLQEELKRICLIDFYEIAFKDYIRDTLIIVNKIRNAETFYRNAYEDLLNNSITINDYLTRINTKNREIKDLKEKFTESVLQVEESILSKITNLYVNFIGKISSLDKDLDKDLPKNIIFNKDLGKIIRYHNDLGKIVKEKFKIIDTLKKDINKFAKLATKAIGNQRYEIYAISDESFNDITENIEEVDVTLLVVDESAIQEPEDDDSDTKQYDQEGNIVVSIDVDKLLDKKVEEESIENFQSMMLPYLSAEDDGTITVERSKSANRYAKYANHKKFTRLLLRGGRVIYRGKTIVYKGLNHILEDEGGLFIARFNFIKDIIMNVNYIWSAKARVESLIPGDEASTTFLAVSDALTFFRIHNLSDEDCKTVLEEIDKLVFKLCKTVRNQINTAFDDELIRLYDQVNCSQKISGLSDMHKSMFSLPIVSVREEDIKKRGRRKTVYTSDSDTPENRRFLKLATTGSKLKVSSESEQSAISAYNKSLNGSEVFKGLKLLYSRKKEIDSFIDYDIYITIIKKFIQSSIQMIDASTAANNIDIVNIYNYIISSYTYFIKSLSVSVKDLDTTKPFELKDLADRNKFSEMVAEFNETKAIKIESLRKEIDDLKKDIDNYLNINKQFTSLFKGKNLDQVKTIQRTKENEYVLDYMIPRYEEFSDKTKELNKIKAEQFDYNFNFLEIFISVLNKKITEFNEFFTFSTVKDLLVFISDNIGVFNTLCDSQSSNGGLLVRNIIHELTSKVLHQNCINEFEQTVNTLIEKNKEDPYSVDVFYKSLIEYINSQGGEEFLNTIKIEENPFLLRYIVEAQNYIFDTVNDNFDKIKIAINDIYTLLDEQKKRLISGEQIRIFDYLKTVNLNNLNITSEKEKKLRIKNIQEINDTIISKISTASFSISSMNMPPIDEDYELDKNYILDSPNLYLSKQLTSMIQFSYELLSKLIDRKIEEISVKTLESFLKSLKNKNNAVIAYNDGGTSNKKIKDTDVTFEQFSLLYKFIEENDITDIIVTLQTNSQDVVTVNEEIKPIIVSYINTVAEFAKLTEEVSSKMEESNDKIYFKKASSDFSRAINSYIDDYKSGKEININEFHQLILTHSFTTKQPLSFENLAAVIKQAGGLGTGGGAGERQRYIASNTKIQKFYSSGPNFNNILTFLFAIYSNVLKIFLYDDPEHDVDDEEIEDLQDIIKKYSYDDELFSSIIDKPVFYKKALLDILKMPIPKTEEEAKIAKLEAEASLDFYSQSRRRLNRESEVDYIRRINRLKGKEAIAKTLTHHGSSFRRFYSLFIDQYFRTLRINNERLIMVALKKYFAEKLPDYQFFQTGIDEDLFFPKEKKDPKGRTLKKANATSWARRGNPGWDPNSGGFLLNPLIFFIQDRTYGNTRNTHVTISKSSDRITFTKDEKETKFIYISDDVFKISKERKNKFKADILKKIEGMRRPKPITQDDIKSVIVKARTGAINQRTDDSGNILYLDDNNALNDKVIEDLLNEIDNKDTLLGQLRFFMLSLDENIEKDMKIFIMNKSIHRNINNRILTSLLNAKTISPSFKLFEEYTKVVNRLRENEFIQATHEDDHTLLNFKPLNSSNILRQFENIFKIFATSICESIVYHEKLQEETEKVDTGIIDVIQKTFFIKSDIDPTEYIKSRLINNMRYTSATEEERLFDDKRWRISFQIPFKIYQKDSKGDIISYTIITYMWSNKEKQYTYGKVTIKDTEEIKLYKYAVTYSNDDDKKPSQVIRMQCDDKEIAAYNMYVSNSVAIKKARDRSAFVLDSDKEVLPLIAQVNEALTSIVRQYPKTGYDVLNKFLNDNLFIEFDKIIVEEDEESTSSIDTGRGEDDEDYEDDDDDDPISAKDLELDFDDED